ncbi:MAG: transcriptional regulator [Candidatus Atabeyarchaeum deiterrae]
MESSLDKGRLGRLARRIAGEISLSDDPGKTMRKWREIFHVNQADLSQCLKISPSVISDYESGRRKSPGTRAIKRFVEALLHIDEKSGGGVKAAFERLLSVEVPTDIILDIKEFNLPVRAQKVCDALQANVAAREDLLDRELLGYTVVDGLGALNELSGEAFAKLFATMDQRALIFTQISTGRSPLVAVKVGEVKPSLVVLHGRGEVEYLAVEMAQREGIPLLVSQIESVSELIRRLREL